RHDPHHQQHAKQDHITEIPVSDLPAAITAYVSHHYAHATIQRAGKANSGGYILQVKKADGISVGLLFDAGSHFVSEKNHHNAHNTAVAVTHLPATVTSYISAHYPGATIEKFTKDSHGHFIVLIKKADASLAGLGFDGAGKFINEVTIKAKPAGHHK
ncbi:MAG TPA: PepSY-like domain-containing protein, partial [Niastella sp.]|nr:PepSY-like domain-containing protein [Niastella sp.]